MSCCPVLLRTAKYYASTTKYYSVLQSTTPVLLCTTKYYSVQQSTNPVLLRTTKYYSSTTKYHSVLQSTNPVLLRTAKYYASTTKYFSSSTPYYKALLRTTRYYASTTLYYKVQNQYYKVLQSITPVLPSTTPVLLCTTKYYSSTTPYCKVLRQYFSVLQSTTAVLQSTTPVLQSTTPVLQSTTPSSEPATKSDTWASPNIAPVKQNDSHVWSWSHMKPHLQCAEQQVSPSNLTKYCACHTEWLACLIVVTYETSFTMRGATGVTIQPHQILRLPHRMTRMLDRRHIWNVIYNARSNRCHHPTSPNTAPATQNDSHAWSSSHMKRHLQCAEQQVSPPSRSG